jgi:hypothetical protein
MDETTEETVLEEIVGLVVVVVEIDVDDDDDDTGDAVEI